MAAAGRSRFASLNEEQFDDLMKKEDSENTQNYEKGGNCFQGLYVTVLEKNHPEDFKNFDKNELGNVLSRFYVEAAAGSYSRSKDSMMAHKALYE